ncbi:hypothetical protein [Micromonospora tarensis]|uniref:Esterase Ig-like N-terminal domain-containing protein n=1 Tax=Micromonospora tarensis TaxID=2806100 RepID=A0ABS1YAW0_9ACTN|nr:hypothetical protein [Micromonospora tarensis]MBM0274535.1 hypothetical protein [Micromonospora tarensis]
MQCSGRLTGRRGRTGGTAYGSAGENSATTHGIRSITPITTVHTYGQKVSAVAIEYPATVNPRTLDTATFSVTDTIYNFRFNPIEDLPKLADRTITHTYTNGVPGTRADHRSAPGRYVIVELDPADTGGSTVIVSKCPTFLCTVKVNPELPTRVVQRKDVHGQPGRGVGKGPLLARATPGESRPVTEKPVNQLVDEFNYGSFLSGGMVLPYHYHLPKNYQPARKYPLVVVLPGHGMGWDGDNLGVQLAADIPATAWLQPEWTGSAEEVIVLAPQHQRVGARRGGPAGQAARPVRRPVRRGHPPGVRVHRVVRLPAAVGGLRQAAGPLRRRPGDRRLPGRRQPGDRHRGGGGAGLDHPRRARPPAERLRRAQLHRRAAAGVRRPG